jgi:hypothetical protein
MKSVISLSILILVLLSAGMAMAIEFFGASVSDLDAPDMYMKWGIIGPRPIVTSVLPDSPAELAGFGRGNIIISVNGTAVGNSTELSRYSADKLAVLVFSGDDQVTLTIDRFAYEAAQANRANTNTNTNTNTTSGAAAPPPPPADPAVIQPDNSPAIVLDNATIDAVYGAATPEQRALEAQRANQIRLDNERDLKLQQERDLQRRSLETEQARQRQDAELRARENEQIRSEDLRREENMRDMGSRDGGMERGRR